MKQVKQALLPIIALLLFLSSCSTSEKIIYFQDIAEGESAPTQAITPFTFKPGDRLSIIVTSSATPTIAMRFNLPIATIQAGSTNQSYSNQIALYTVDENGQVDIPSLGRINIGGLTRSQAADKIQAELRKEQLKDAVVTISSYDQSVTVMGEVSRPGKVQIDRDNITILEAIGAAGDLTIQARRDKILVLRQEGGETKSYYVDIRSKDLLNSPVYNLKQNDIVYVQPNKVRMGQSTNNDNSVRSIATWLSVSSVLISLGILIFN